MISLQSELVRRILNYFFINSQEALYLNELSRKFNIDKRNLAKKLKELEIEGIFVSEVKGNLKLYSINKDYSLYKEYEKIILKTVGFEGILKKILFGVKGVEQSYIYGSYVNNKMDVYSDIDLLVVGSHSIIDLQKKISKLQKDINREINIVNMDLEEFQRRINKNDSFIRSILKNKHIKIIK